MLAIEIIIFYYIDNKGLTTGYAIAESSAVISLMFLIVGIKALDITFTVSAVVVLIILLGVMLRHPQKYLS